MADACPQAETATNAPLGPDDPVRLAVAVKVFFPAGGITVSSLRTEIRKGRLACERIAGKDHVTKRAILEMRKKCRVQAKAPGSICAGGKTACRNMSSETAAHLKSAQDAALSSATKLRECSQTTSPPGTIPGKAKVIHARFR